MGFFIFYPFLLFFVEFCVSLQRSKEVTATLNYKIMTSTYKITTKKTGAGHFTVTIFNNKKWEEKGSFETTDAGLIDDLDQLENGFESELLSFDTFNELIQDCLHRLG